MAHHPATEAPGDPHAFSGVVVEGVPIRQLLWFHLFGEAQRRQSLNIWTTFPKELLAVQRSFQQRLLSDSVDFTNLWIRNRADSPTSRGNLPGKRYSDGAPTSLSGTTSSKRGAGLSQINWFAAESILHWRLRRWIQRALERRRVSVVQNASEALQIHTRSALLPIEKGAAALDVDMFSVERVAANLVPATEISLVPSSHHSRYALRLNLDLLESVHELLWLPLLKIELQRKNRGSPSNRGHPADGNPLTQLPQISKGIFRHCLRTLHLIMFSKDRPTHELDREFAFFANPITSASPLNFRSTSGKESSDRLRWLADLQPLLKAEANTSDFRWTLNHTLERLTEPSSASGGVAPSASEAGVHFFAFYEFVLSAADWFCVTSSVNEYGRFVTLWAEQASDARPTVSVKPWKATDNVSQPRAKISTEKQSAAPPPQSPKNIFDMGSVGIPISLSNGGKKLSKGAGSGTGRRSRTPGKDRDSAFSRSPKSLQSSVLQSPLDSNLHRNKDAMPETSREFIRFQQSLATPMFLSDPRKKSHSRSPPSGAGSFRIPVITPIVPAGSRTLSIREAIFGRKSFLETPPSSTHKEEGRERGSFRLSSETTTPVPASAPGPGRSPLLTAFGSGILHSSLSPRAPVGGDGVTVHFVGTTPSVSAGGNKGPGSPKFLTSATQDGFLAPSATLTLLPAPQGQGQKLLTESFSTLPINESFSSPPPPGDEDRLGVDGDKPGVTDAETYGGLLGSAEEVLQQALRFAHVEGTFVAPAPPLRQRSPRGFGTTHTTDDTKECFRRASLMVRRRSSVAAARALSKLEAVSAFSELRMRNSFSKSGSSSVFASSMNDATKGVAGRKHSGVGMTLGRPRVTLTYDTSDPCADPATRHKSEQESCVTVECCLSTSAFETPVRKVVPRDPSGLGEHRWPSSAASIRPHRSNRY